VLNTFAFDLEDEEFIVNSFNQIKDKRNLELITDDTIRNEWLTKVLSKVGNPNNARCSFQNLFKLKSKNSEFYLCQLLSDYGFPFSFKQGQSSEREYTFYILGFAKLKFDFGHTLLRPETKVDKFVSKFIKQDIEFNDSEKFNQKYYLTSNKRELVIQEFDLNFLRFLEKQKDLWIKIDGNEMFVILENDNKLNHLKILEEIFSNCNFLDSVQGKQS
jgi:hypothetical protein